MKQISDQFFLKKCINELTLLAIFFYRNEIHIMHLEENLDQNTKLLQSYKRILNECCLFVIILLYIEKRCVNVFLEL